jgi:hypothetical protein
MDQITKMSRSSHLLLWPGLLLFIFLFFDWQQVCVSFGGNEACGGRSGWHGVGIIVGLLTIALLVWEIVQLVDIALPDLPVKAGMITAALAGGILVFTVIKFLVDNEARHWPAWLGLILSIVIAVGGWLRWSGDAPKVIEMKRSPSSSGASSSAPPPAEPPAAAPPPAETPPPAPPPAEPPPA